MKKTHWVTTSIMFVFLLLPTILHSQGGYPDNEEVHLTADDGVTLIGDYFAPTNPAEEGAFAVLFIHQHGGSRGDVAFLAPPIVNQGYALLSVDLRGHGDTGGEENWEAVTGDLQGWMDWLQNQTGVRQSKGLMTVGVGVGGNYALIACANAAECRTSVAISPLAAGCDVVSCSDEISATSKEVVAYIDETTTAAIRKGLKRRSALLVLSQRSIVSDSGKYLVTNSTGDIQATIFGSAQFGMEFFGVGDDTIPNLVIEWLKDHT